MSMQGIVVCLGVSSVVFFFTSITFFAGWRLTSTAQHALSHRAFQLAGTLALDVEESILIDDNYSAYRSLTRAMSNNTDVVYAYIQLYNGKIFTHTFEGGFPKQILTLKHDNKENAITYSTPENRILEVSVPLLENQLGSLRLGISQKEVFQEQRFFILVMSGILAFSMGITFIVAHQIGVFIGKPMRQLADMARSIPYGKINPDDISTEGTSEVRSLSLAFREMVYDLHRLESESRATQRHMVSAERLAALGELSAGLAHEIMNPLDGVMEGCRHIKSQISNSGHLVRYLQLMESGLVRIERVMRQMLDYARGSGVEPQLEEYDLKGIIKEISELAYPQMRKRKVELKLDCECSFNAICDRQLLSQALLNLLLNAVDACADRENPTIIVSLTDYEDLIQVGVGDSGVGIPENMREKIFTPFFTTKDPDKGTGLGLAMARQAIQQCGGDLQLDTQPSILGGAQFYIVLNPANITLKGHEI
jgi:signal transduction histidine kinase